MLRINSLSGNFFRSRMEKPGITFTLFILLVAILAVVLIHPNSHQNETSSKKSTNSIVADNKPVTIITPETNDEVLGTSTSATLRTYISKEGDYSITYPSDWTPALQQQMQNFTGDISVFTTGPIGNRALGYPSFLQVAVDDNPKDLSLQSFIFHEYKSLHLSSVAIGGAGGLETNDLQGLAPNTTMWVEQSQKIYQIRFFNGALPKISGEQLSKILESFKFN
jgi:hypothetical protein